LATPAAAQPPLIDPGQKTVRVVRTDTPPVIDGVLDEAAWGRAGIVDDLHQTEPIEYAPPFEHTEILMSARASTTPIPSSLRQTTCVRTTTLRGTIGFT
jgi:hypothetical protein